MQNIEVLLNSNEIKLKEGENSIFLGEGGMGRVYCYN